MNMPAAATQQQDDMYGQSSARSLTQEEKEAEKVRLQTLVNTFATSRLLESEAASLRFHKCW
jgi:hypothetical protein